MTSFRTFVGLALGLLMVACIGPDETLPPPILPVTPAARITIEVPPTLNESPLAVVAGLTAATNRMLVATLERSGCYTPADGARFRLETAITSIRDEDATEGVVHSDAKAIGQRRRAVVEMRYRVLDARGTVLLDGAVSGTDESLGAAPIALPKRHELETGAYWETTVGRATRACLDAMVRRMTESA